MFDINFIIAFIYTVMANVNIIGCCKYRLAFAKYSGVLFGALFLVNC